MICFITTTYSAVAPGPLGQYCFVLCCTTSVKYPYELLAQVCRSTVGTCSSTMGRLSNNCMAITIYSLIS